MEEQPNNQANTGARLPNGQFAPGHTGNPAGRPKGQSLKEFARQWFSELSERDKLEFMKKVDPAFLWRMSEGNPAEEKKIGITGAIATSQLSQEQVDKINQVIFDEWENNNEPQEDQKTV